MDQRMCQVQQALHVSFHRRVPQVLAREYIETIKRIHKWNLQAAEQLPQPLRAFYAALYNTIHQIFYTLLRRHGLDVTSHMRRAWVSVCRAYLGEARWHRAGQTPRLEEYLSKLRETMTAPILLPDYFSSPKTSRNRRSSACSPSPTSSTSR